MCRRSSSFRGASPAAVTSYVTAAIGAPVESGGVTAWFHVKRRLLVNRVHVGSVAGGTGEALPKVVTVVLAPSNNATLSRTSLLDAKATGYFKVTRVQFYLTGGSQKSTLIGTGRSTPFGWATRWDTTTVANGKYTVQSVAYDAGGVTGKSAGVSITVSN